MFHGLTSHVNSANWDIVKISTFSSLVTPKNFVMTTIGATRADKVGIITTLCFQWASEHTYSIDIHACCCVLKTAWYVSKCISSWIQAIQSRKAEAKPCTEYIILWRFTIQLIRNINGDVVDHLLSHNFIFAQWQKRHWNRSRIYQTRLSV